jgi:hypothetical protein
MGRIGSAETSKVFVIKWVTADNPHESHFAKGSQKLSFPLSGRTRFGAETPTQSIGIGSVLGA